MKEKQITKQLVYLDEATKTQITGFIDIMLLNLDIFVRLISQQKITFISYLMNKC